MDEYDATLNHTCTDVEVVTLFCSKTKYDAVFTAREAIS